MEETSFFSCFRQIFLFIFLLYPYFGYTPPFFGMFGKAPSKKTLLVFLFVMP